MFGFLSNLKSNREIKRLQKICPHNYHKVSTYDEYNEYRERLYTFCDMFCPHCEHLVTKVEARIADRQIKMQDLREKAGTLIYLGGN